MVEISNLDFGFMLSASCIMNTTFYDRLLVATIGPLAFFMLLVLTYIIAMKRNKHNDEAKGEVYQKHISILLLVTFLIYSSVSTIVFETFSCDSTLDTGEVYLRADYRLTCSSMTYHIYQAYSVLMIVVYPVGIPLCLAAWLFSHKYMLSRGHVVSFTEHSDDVRRRVHTVPPCVSGSGVFEPAAVNSLTSHTPALRTGREFPSEMKTLAPFADLWQPYKPSCYFWEIVEFSRRALLTGVGVFIFPNSAAQIAVVLLVAGAFAVVFEVLDPYREHAATWLYRTGYVIVILTMYLALLLRVNLSDEDATGVEVFGILLIIVHCVMILAVFLEGTYVACDAWKSMRGAE